MPRRRKSSCTSVASLAERDAHSAGLAVDLIEVAPKRRQLRPVRWDQRTKCLTKWSRQEYVWIDRYRSQERKPMDRAEYLDRIRGLIPAIRDRAAACESQRRIPDETFKDFEQMGLFRALQPRRWGGFELDP